MKTILALNDLRNKLRTAARWMKTVRSYDSHSRRTCLPGPVSVQIQTIDRCNASCIMCPYSQFAHAGPGNLMDDGLFLRILDEIRITSTVQNLCMMLQNEPLLDRKFSHRVRLARQRLHPGVRIMTVTNGAPLTPAMIEELRVSGIDNVVVSIDAIRGDTYARIRQGLDFERVMRNTHALIDSLGARRVSITFLRQRANEGEEHDFADYWRRLGVRVAFKEMTNRAGALDAYERVKKQRPDPWKQWVHPALNRLIPACPLPFSFLSVLWDGRVILCGEDWGPRDIVGDLSKQTLSQVWNGEKINHYRHLLWTHKAEESHVCAGCSQSERFWRQ